MLMGVPDESVPDETKEEAREKTQASAPAFDT